MPKNSNTNNKKLKRIFFIKKLLHFMKDDKFIIFSIDEMGIGVRFLICSNIFLD